jgi:RNA polymerase sigma factor (sigma-70 family)
MKIATMDEKRGEKNSTEKIEDDLLVLAAGYLAALNRGDQPDETLTCHWHQFYFECNRIIEQHLAKLLKCPMDRSDCLQEIWWQLLRRLKDVKKFFYSVTFEAWLTGLCRNQARLILRKKTLKRSINIDPKTLDSTWINWKDDPVRILEQRFERSLLNTALEQLEKSVSATSYRVFMMYRFEGRSAKEITDLLELTLNQVQSRQFRVHKKFKQWCRQFQSNVLIHRLELKNKNQLRPNRPR